MNKCIEEEREEVPFIEENPEIRFLELRIMCYKEALYQLKDNPAYEDLYEYKSLMNLISQCQRKILMITAFQISQAMNISLKEACIICKTT